VRKLSLLAAACLITGAGLVLYTAYRIWDPAASGIQHRLTAKLHTRWKVQVRPIKVRVGQPFAIMRIPEFGPHWKFAIVEGTSLRQLAEGPGHVPGTALPGVPGNFAVAAHDITAGNPFLHLGSLRRGDAVIVQTADARYRYQVRSEQVVRYTDTSVLDPVPGRPYVQPKTQVITLITCTPVTLAFTPWRIVVTGTLAATTVRHGPAATIVRHRPRGG